MLHALTLSASLAFLWLMLSGHYDALLLAFGVLSVAFVVVTALRMDVVDDEAQPLSLGFGVLRYWAWLGVEILKSNIDVAKVILDPKLPISPQHFKATTAQLGTVGRVTYANSITLTPGTVSLSLDDGEVEVHAITRDTAAGVQSGEMLQHIAGLESKGTEVKETAS